MANPTKVAPRTYKTRIDLPEHTRVQVTEVLNESLALTLDLWSQIKQAHWNVKGKDFYQLHELFDEIASEVYEYTDMIAERVTALGCYARGTVKMAAEKSSLPDYPTDAVNGKEHLTALIERLAAYARHVRENIDKTDELKDKDTADLYTEISRTIDKRLWFLEAHIQGE
jgi:starvation-inducible DNA-binding protein